MNKYKYSDEDLLLLTEAMYDEYAASLRNIRIVANHGPNYRPWRRLVDDFYERFPDWVPDPKNKFSPELNKVINKEEYKSKSFTMLDAWKDDPVVFLFIAAIVIFLFVVFLMSLNAAGILI